MIAHVFAAMTAGKQARRLKLTDFLLRWAKPQRRQSAEEQLNIFRALARKQESHGNHR